MSFLPIVAGEVRTFLKRLKLASSIGLIFMECEVDSSNVVEHPLQAMLRRFMLLWHPLLHLAHIFNKFFYRSISRQVNT